MGIIEKQATKNAIFSYIGAALGFITLFWTPRLLSTEENGLLRVLTSYAVLFSQFSNLGFSAATLRFFPHFRDDEKGHNGFLYYVLAVPATGFLISCIFFVCFREQIISNNVERSPLLADYIYYLLPLTLFTLFYNVFDTYLRASYNSVIGSSTKEVLQRILILTVLALYFFKVINFHLFIFLYTVSISVPTLVLMFNLILNKKWHTKRNKHFMTPKVRKDIIRLSTYTILSEFSAGIIISIDSLMLNYLLGLSKTGVYSISFNFGNLMTIPARSLSRITSSVLVENFKLDNLKEIASLYKKSCSTQLAVGAILFIGIIINLENIMYFLPPDYYSGRYVIIILSGGYFIEMATGLNHAIVVFSKYYKYDSYFIFALVFVAIGLNYMLIPKYNITGAAIATAATLTFGNIVRSVYVYMKFRMQPYDKKTVLILVAGTVAFLAAYLIPSLHGILSNKTLSVGIDIAVRSGLATGIFILLLLKFEAAPEVNSKIRKNLKHFSINL